MTNKSWLLTLPIVFCNNASAEIVTTFGDTVIYGGSTAGVRQYKSQVDTKQHTGTDVKPETSGNFPNIYSSNFSQVIGLTTNGDSDHGFGNSLNVRYFLSSGIYRFALYGHMNNVNHLAVNQFITRGQYINQMGGTGYGNAGYSETEWTTTKQTHPRTYGWMHHLHYEINEERGLNEYGYSSGDPDNFGYFNPISFSRDNEIALPILSTTDLPNALTNYTVYGVENKPLYGFINISGTFNQSSIIVRDLFKREQIEDPGTLKDTLKFLGGRNRDMSISTISGQARYPIGDYLFAGYTSSGGVRRFGYPIKMTIVKSGDFIIDNDQSNADENPNNDTKLVAAYNGTRSNSIVPGYFLTADLHRGRSEAFAQWKPYKAEKYKIYVHIPEYGSTATSVRYAIKIDGKSKLLSKAIDHTQNRDQWVQLTLDDGTAEFSFTKAGYVGLSLSASTSSDNYDISDDQFVAFDALKFKKVSLPDATWTKNPSNNHYYKVLQNCGNWEQCEAAAVAQGSHLVTIRNQAENDWLVNTFGTSVFWIGLTDRNSEGSWVWSSGEPVTYTNWHPQTNEPNGGTNENFGQINWGIGEWNDINPSWSPSTSAIIEYNPIAPMTGSFSVSANNPEGQFFIPPLNASTCNFSATGTWGYGAGLSSSPDGVYFNGGNWYRMLATAEWFSLIASYNGSYIPIGSASTVKITKSTKLSFMINEGRGGIGDPYADNSGALTVSYSCTQ